MQTAVVCLHVKPGKSEGGAFAEGQRLESVRLNALKEAVNSSCGLRLGHNVRSGLTAEVSDGDEPPLTLQLTLS